MLIYTTENIFNSPAQTLVNTVNTYGVMGKGIAKDFKEYYPEMFNKYRKICKEKKLDIGMLLLSKEEPVVYRGKATGEFRQKWVLNFPTKRHWRGKSQLEFIENGLQKFVKTFEEKNIKSVSFPQLGIGNGGLDWKQVQPLMEQYLKDLPIPVYIHLYSNKDYFNEVDRERIEKNLNTRHDAWRTEELIKKISNESIIEDKAINSDGVVLPKELFVENEDTFNYLETIVNHRKIRVIDPTTNEVYYALKIEKGLLSEQLELFADSVVYD